MTDSALVKQALKVTDKNTKAQILDALKVVIAELRKKPKPQPATAESIQRDREKKESVVSGLELLQKNPENFSTILEEINEHMDEFFSSMLKTGHEKMKELDQVTTALTQKQKELKEAFEIEAEMLNLKAIVTAQSQLKEDMTTLEKAHKDKLQNESIEQAKTLEKKEEDWSLEFARSCKNARAAFDDELKELKKKEMAEINAEREALKIEQQSTQALELELKTKLKELEQKEAELENKTKQKIESVVKKEKSRADMTIKEGTVKLTLTEQKLELITEQLNEVNKTNSMLKNDLEAANERAAKLAGEAIKASAQSTVVQMPSTQSK